MAVVDSSDRRGLRMSMSNTLLRLGFWAGVGHSDTVYVGWFVWLLNYSEGCAIRRSDKDEVYCPD
ncbi:hypothetical protein K491DRAFT_692806 [Lophiostoma macrostomum CBS 122681]|uniref:Uncharacterized protein n=1 Tax=Lophiostoma macrostomum CBS 122681 TaxID=1314788 RepID=A0A6A6T8Q3_9PLEO|nr:hypothetical protein K491DRAFT_692806 [Lophiostoma macrostomum CBS 122681]